jgi:hypothetical protein
MTTAAECLAFVKSKARIATSDTTRDTDIYMSINAAYRHVCGRDFWPFLRTPATQALTAGTQDYALPSDFGQMAAESVRVYQTNTTVYQYLSQALAPDADLYENLQSTYQPVAWRIVAGTSNLLRKIRLLPNFTATGYTLGYDYYKRIADVSGADVLGDPLICDAVAWWALAQDKDWNRDPDQSQAHYLQQYKTALRDAQSTNFP